MFIGTAICGTMPSFATNLLMCSLMGLAAGGMLPMVYALMAESVPARPRGWLVVLHGGIGTIGGTLAAAGCAALLEPVYGWRALWLVNLPTGICMLALNRWIPESPRSLLDQERVDEAAIVMARYGVVIAARPLSPGEEDARKPSLKWSDLAALFQRPLRSQTAVVFTYGLAWGVMNWGFLSLLPTFLRGAGLGAGAASALLFFSTLVAIPGTVLVAYLYGRWSTRKNMVSFAVASVVFALVFSWVAPWDTNDRVLTIRVGFAPCLDCPAFAPVILSGFDRPLGQWTSPH